MMKILLTSVAAAGLVFAPVAATAQVASTGTFDIVDTDHSGEVSLVELQAIVEDDNDENDLSEQDFARFDLDGSGGLNAEEFEMAITSLGVATGSVGTSDDDGEDDTEE
jgi:hypothetical protein